VRTPLPLALAYGLGLAAGLIWPVYVGNRLMSLTCLGMASALALAQAQLRAPLWRALSSKLVIGVSALLGLCSSPRTTPEPLPDAGLVRVQAEVEEVRHGLEGQARSRIRVLEGTRLADGAPVPAGAHLIAAPFPLPEHARISLLAAIRPALPFRNATPHPPLRAAHPTRGIARLPAPSAVAVLEHPAPFRWIDAVRAHVRARLSTSLAPDVAAVARAILLGDPDVLEEAEAADVRDSGLSHVFAVSGMHVTLLAGLSVWLLTQGLLRIPRLANGYDVPRIAAGLGIPLALSIAALTGGAPSGWRASITTAIAWAVTACGRRPDATAVTAAACLVFAAATPTDALRPAFLLSIAATAALIGHNPPANAGFAGTLRGLVQLTLRTTLATAPIVWWSFGSLPAVGLLANLLLVPVGSLLLLIAAGHACVACTVVALAPVSAAALEVVARAFMHGARACSELDPHWPLPVLSLGQGVALSCGVMGVLYLERRRAKWWAAGLALAMGLAGEWHLRATEQPTGSLRATFVDVGQGDAAIVDLPDGRVMLIDAGGNPQAGPDPGERALLPLLAARRRSSLDIVVLTHPHPDHYGGLGALLPRLPVGELWDSGQSQSEADFSPTSRAALELVQDATRRGARLLRPDTLCDGPRNFGGAQISVLSPCPGFDPGYDPNDNSLVLRIVYGGRALLFTGDIEAHAEAALLASGRELRADVFKVPHHGSRTSSSEALLRAVRPELAVVSRGAVNPFGHPHPEVMERLRRLVGRVIDLGERGGTIVTVEREGGMRVETTLP